MEEMCPFAARLSFLSSLYTFRTGDNTPLTIDDTCSLGTVVYVQVIPQPEKRSDLLQLAAAWRPYYPPLPRTALSLASSIPCTGSKTQLTPMTLIGT
jgi:hypothetical protein